MRSIHDYLKEYGKYTFLEKEFNEVDNVILSELSYIDFSGIVPMIDGGSIKLKDASRLFYERYDKKEIKKNILSVREAEFLLKEIADSNRFKNLELLNYEYQVSFEEQFGALCIKLPNRMMYVSYEGTDNYVSGWKEDFMLSYNFPVRSQALAIEYLNMVASKNPFGPKIYVGGHSKGGNLALVAAMYCKNRVYRKIKQVYSNDGPGLRKKEFETNRYKRVAYRFTHIVPEESFIGMILTSDDNFTVIKSSKKKFFQHDATSWVVEGNHFARGELSEFSNRARKAMLNWLAKLNDKQKEEFVRVAFGILKSAEIDDLNDIKQSKISNMMKILKEMKNVSRENRDMLTNVLKRLYEEWKLNEN